MEQKTLYQNESWTSSPDAASCNLQGQQFHVGELDKFINFEYEKEAESLRDISDGILLVNNLVEKLASFKNHRVYSNKN